jgi:phosphatidylinositol alpha-mannosyltransferase
VFTDLGNPDRAWWRGVGRHDVAALRRVVRSIDVYGCMSRWSLAFLARDWGRTDGVVTPGGVSLEEFRPASARADVPTLLFSGAVTEPRKGVADLLAALPSVIEREPDVRLQLSGPGDPAELLAAAPPEVVGRVEVLGRGTPGEQRDHYGAAWLTVLPSTHDSFGMALVESLACGTPLVVTTHGAPHELVDDGITGVRCRPHDPADLADAIVRGLALTRRSTTVAACRQSAERFDWATSLAPACEALYGRTASGGDSPSVRRSGPDREE